MVSYNQIKTATSLVLPMSYHARQNAKKNAKELPNYCLQKSLEA